MYRLMSTLCIWVHISNWSHISYLARKICILTKNWIRPQFCILTKLRTLLTDTISLAANQQICARIRKKGSNQCNEFVFEQCFKSVDWNPSWKFGQHHDFFHRSFRCLEQRHLVTRYFRHYLLYFPLGLCPRI